MSKPRILVAGIGNIFFGDDAFGVEVARRLLRRPWPTEVRVEDFGIRGMDLTYALMDGPQTAILIDALSRGGKPGTLYLLAPTVESESVSAPRSTILEGHSMNPATVLASVARLGGGPGRAVIVGCEPTPLSDENDMRMQVSAPIAAAIDEAAQLVESMIERAMAGQDLLGLAWTAEASNSPVPTTT